MNPLSEIRKSIKGMASGNGGLFTAKVLSADGETCCVDIDGLVVSDVQLRAVVNGEESGILITPKTGSYLMGTISIVTLLSSSTLFAASIITDTRSCLTTK